MQIRNVYVFIDKDKVDYCLKYGIKISMFYNAEEKIMGLKKKGIKAYLSPKDCDKYNDEGYEILRVKLNSEKAYVVNEQNSDFCKIDKYNFGDFILPEVIITTSVAPEDVFVYNKILDVPLIVQNSKEFYLSRIEEEKNEIESSKYTFNDLLKNKKLD
ncbi:MAG: hypothetical protein IJ809_00960 [Clostridia bacterium]|nr:hypothetical protein [Clostridia bacterium]